MNKISRRTFIGNTSLVAAGTLLVPEFLKASDHVLVNGNGFKRLVVVQLGGGNDGLNNIIPYRNDLYYQNRPFIGIQENDLLKTGADFGFHPEMNGFRSLYDKGYLSIINSVGYPNSNRSHFRSMDIWNSASGSNEYLDTGWIGRYLDSCCNKPHLAIEVDDMLSRALKGEKINGMAMKDTRKLIRALRDRELRKAVLSKSKLMGNADSDNKAFLYKTMADTYSSAAYLNEINRSPRVRTEYPKTAFAQQLSSISNLIAAQSETKVYYVSMGGFDTHFAQKNRQSKLLKDMSTGIEVFVKDLEKSNELDSTMILCFSEFGRRVKQNASGGTDHGSGNVSYLIGSKLSRPGLFNPLPDLENLDKGDIKYNVDFRRIYATILEDWLSADSNRILGNRFDKLSLFS
ncbi:MAG: DUF1501 domain-containing protein [Cyclobacteriaceae bacterium]